MNPFNLNYDARKCFKNKPAVNEQEITVDGHGGYILITSHKIKFI